MLLPLTESLYVSGVLESVESVLLEAGTGYYVEVRSMLLVSGGKFAVVRLSDFPIPAHPLLLTQVLLPLLACLIALPAA